MITKSELLKKSEVLMEAIKLSVENDINTKDFKPLNERQCSFSINELKINVFFFSFPNPIEIHFFENEKRFGITKIAFDSHNQTYRECVVERNSFNFSTDFIPYILKLHSWNTQNISN